MVEWGFYGRRVEIQQLRTILERKRWFFVKLTGRRRIGKTALIQHALKPSGRRILYVQVPDSGPAGVLSAVGDAMDIFRLDAGRYPRPATLGELARCVGLLAREGFVVALDEFQYFHREVLRDFPSLLQGEVDRLTADAANVPGGLLVLGSIHTDIAALLEDRQAPLFNRTTDEIELTHLDIASILEILRTHASPSPDRLLFLWTLFEGVPKFYRDCYEQGVLGAPRDVVLRRIFFESSSPLRTEADNWFLKELRGRYDVGLKFVARNPGCLNGDITQHVRTVSPGTHEQVGGYLKILIDRYRLLERRLPIFATPKARAGRYYLTDNFLVAWLTALAKPISAVAFAPLDELVADASDGLRVVEGHAFEKLVGQLYEERSRRRVGDFRLTARIQGYWDSADTEIDLVALDEPGKRIRFGTCKRAEDKLVGATGNLNGHIDRFLQVFPQYGSWTVERVGFAPTIGPDVRRLLRDAGFLAQDLDDLTRDIS